MARIWFALLIYAGLSCGAIVAYAQEVSPVPPSARFRPLPSTSAPLKPIARTVRQVADPDVANDLRPVEPPSLIPGNGSEIKIRPVQITLPTENGNFAVPATPPQVPVSPGFAAPTLPATPPTAADVLPPSSSMVQPNPVRTPVTVPSTSVPSATLQPAPVPTTRWPAVAPESAVVSPSDALTWQPPTATVDNSRFVTRPVPTSATFWGCEHYIQPTGYTTVPVSNPPYAPPPAVVVPPTLVPGPTTQPYITENAGYRPLFTLGQENYNVQLGRGIIGQPTAYVPGQTFRNFLRYLFP